MAGRVHAHQPVPPLPVDAAASPVSPTSGSAAPAAGLTWIDPRPFDWPVMVRRDVDMRTVGLLEVARVAWLAAGGGIEDGPVEQDAAARSLKIADDGSPSPPSDRASSWNRAPRPCSWRDILRRGWRYRGVPPPSIAGTGKSFAAQGSRGLNILDW